MADVGHRSQQPIRVYCHCGRTEIVTVPGVKIADLTCPWCRDPKPNLRLVKE